MLDALIIGAGPTGLALGCELIKQGLKVRLVEKLPQATDQSRALALQSRTLEIFEKMGLIDRFLQRGRIIRQANFSSNRKLISSIAFASYLKTSYPFLLVVPQAVTEEILADHFESMGGVVERRISLQALDKTRAILQHNEGSTETVDAKWVFGCDGAHSATRHLLNVPFKGIAFPETFALADVTMDISLATDQIHFFSHKKNFCMMVRLPEEKNYRVVAHTGNPINIKEGIAFFESFIQQSTGHRVKITQADWMSLFTIQRRIATHMRVGNCFLLGDAAHIHSPAGGQGLNTSVQDAFNLSWKIALVHRGLAPDSLLDSYEKERLPVAKNVLKSTTLITYIMTSGFLKKLLFPLAALLLKKETVKKHLAEGISELDIAYRDSPIIVKERDKHWKGPKSGERAPDAPLSHQERLFQRMRHPLHTFLCFGGKELDPLLALIKSYSEVIHIVQLEPSSDAGRVYHADSPCFYLIRPDGVIGYRSRSLDRKGLTTYLKKIFR